MQTTFYQVLGKQAWLIASVLINLQLMGKLEWWIIMI